MRYFFSTLLFATALSLKAQYHDVKLDAGGLIYGHYGLAYEYAWNDYNGLNLRVGYIGEPNFDVWRQGRTDYPKDLSQFNASLDYRRYQSPDEGADRRFYGFYTRFRSISYNIPEEAVSFDESQLAIGALYGTKWLFRSGLFFEYYAGFGLYLDNVLGSTEFGFNYTSYDYRLGLTVGYRFF